MLSLHGGFLTIAMYHYMKTIKSIIILLKKKERGLTTHWLSELKKNPQLNHGGPSHKQASGSDPPMNALSQCRKFV